jgi:hypothetical protein
MKKMWIIVSLTAVGIICLAVYFYRTLPAGILSPVTISSNNSDVSKTTPAQGNLLTWDDPAGFSFTYPEDLSVNKHAEDNDNYAHVELTNKNHPGGIIVWASDLPKGVTNIANWITKTPSYTTATIIDSTLDKQPAKKILIASPVKKIIVGTISEELLFSIEGTLTDTQYWQNVHNTITTSFKFTPEGNGQQSNTSPNTTSESAADEEETIE